MKVGLAIGGSLQDVAVLACRTEAAGLDSVWLAELDHSAFVQTAAAGRGQEPGSGSSPRALAELLARHPVLRLFAGLVGRRR
jgi:hypothetical protein